MESDLINEQLFIDLRQYILSKTNKLYFNKIRQLSEDVMISCPYHKEGQERKPSCGVKRVSDVYGPAGTLHCFSCGATTNLSEMMKDILGDLYNEDEVESRFNLKLISAQSSIQQERKVFQFDIPKKLTTEEDILKHYRFYHPYLETRGITKEVAELYDIGFDEYNDQITFPLRDIMGRCIGIGRRSIKFKQYEYPAKMVKPLYGVYELGQVLRYVWVVEGPFNLWSLRVWGKQGVALLGTGTQTQYKELLKLKCKGFVLALDGDEAGHKGTEKLKQFLLNNKRIVHTALIPEGKDINDLSHEEFRQVQVI